MPRKTDKELMSAIGLPWFAVAEYKEAARNYRGRKIEKAIQALNDCDLKFKGIEDNTGDEKALFQETLLKILSL
jgi:DNA polymerase III delta subunit